MKKLRQFMSMLLSLMLCVGEFASTGLSAFAADNEETVVEVAPDDGAWTGEGSGTASDPYMIGTKEQLEKFRDIVNGTNGEAKNTAACAELTADIELDDTWTPIADSSSEKYSGSFDGKNHFVKNASEKDLFEYVGTGGSIKNLGDYEGRYVVYYNFGTVECCTIKGTGLIANENSGTVTQCNKETTSRLVNENMSGGTVSLCVNLAEIIDADTAGIVNINSGTVEKCINMGDVNSKAAGIAIANSGTILNCLNTGMIGGWKYEHGYGIVFYSTGGRVENCLTLCGGICDSGDKSKMIHNYCVGYDDYGNMITNEELKEQSTFEGFDFTDVWIMGDNCPTLRNIKGHIHVYSVEAKGNKAVVKCTASDCPNGTNVEYTVSIIYDGEAGRVICDKDPMPSCVGLIGYPYYTDYANIPKEPGNYKTGVSVGDKFISFEFEVVTNPFADGTYTVHFETKGGSGVANEKVNSGGKAIKPSDPTKDGYTFEGWYEDSEFTIPFDFDTTITGDTTIYAKWGDGVKKESYTVTFSLNGKPGTAPEPQTVKEGYKAKVPAVPALEGYTFVDWYTTPECADAEKYDFATPVNANITLYAKWIGVERTVTFDMGGKTANITVTVENGQCVTKPEDPKAENYTFINWYKDSDYKTLFDFTTKIEADTTIYAKWVDNEAKLYTVSFNSNGVEAKGMPSDYKVEEGTTVSKPDADPTAENYTFKGWFSDKECKTAFVFPAVINADTVIYAGWKKNGTIDPAVGSALDNRPVINETTSDIYLVKGQKFFIGKEWSVADRVAKQYVSIDKKGYLKAKKLDPESVTVKIKKEGRADITVHICQPALSDKKKILIIDDADKKTDFTLSISKDDGIKNVLWYSAAPDVATVDQTGKVTAVAQGKAKITAYVNGKAYNCNITVKESVAAKNRTLHVNLDGSKSIKVKGVRNWTSADETIATKAEKGEKFTAKSAGKTVLSASENDIKYTIDFYGEDITVKGDKISNANKNKYTINDLKVGTATDISLPGVKQDVVFKSSKPDVAFVDEKGHIVARSKGKAKLTTKINGKTITILVVVNE